MTTNIYYWYNKQTSILLQFVETGSQPLLFKTRNLAINVNYEDNKLTNILPQFLETDQQIGVQKNGTQ